MNVIYLKLNRLSNSLHTDMEGKSVTYNDNNRAQIGKRQKDKGCMISLKSYIIPQQARD